MARPMLFLWLWALAAPVWAQWPAFPGQGVPMKDGKPDLAAAAPRTAWNTPDFTGLWENLRPITQPASGPPTATFANVGAGYKDGLPLRPWAAEIRRVRMEQHSKDNPDALCLPMGFMQFHTHPQPRKIVQTPELLLIIYEANSGLRQIFLDGRPQPPADADPWWYGYSTGHWEGDTLVVETVNQKDMGWLDIDGTPITTSGRVIERFRRPDYGSLEIEITVEDLQAYTAPWTVMIRQRLTPGQELIEFICAENDRFTKYLEGAARK